MTQGATNGGSKPAFPVLHAALKKYFPNASNGGRDDSARLFANYQKTGGTGLEFDGLLDEIKAAARTPESALWDVEDALGIQVDSNQLKEMLYEWHDALTGTGLFSPEVMERAAIEDREAREAAKPSTDELLANYAKPRIKLPGILSRFSAPLWVFFVGSVAAMIVSAGILYLIPKTWGIATEVLTWPFTLLLVASVVVAVATGATMIGLRKDTLKPDDGKAGKVSRLVKFR